MTDKQLLGKDILCAAIAHGGLPTNSEETAALVARSRRVLREALQEGSHGWQATSEDPIPDGASEQTPFRGLGWVAAQTPGWVPVWNEGTEEWFLRTANGSKGQKISDPVTYYMAVSPPP